MNIKDVSDQQVNNLINLLDGYTEKGGQHVNINVLDRETLIEAQKYPDQYPNIVVRVSGYAVYFHNLTEDQQNDVIMRTFHKII